LVVVDEYNSVNNEHCDSEDKAYSGPYFQKNYIVGRKEYHIRNQGQYCKNIQQYDYGTKDSI